MSAFVSVVTVVRNNAEGLITTARSVLAQEFPDLEYVVIDGASTDETKIALEQFAKYIDVLVCEPDSGIYFAMNKAIERLSGKWVHFLNCEDTFYDPKTLSNLVAALREDDDILHGQSFNIDTQALHRFKPPHLYWSGMTFDHQATFTRSAIYKELRYDTGFRINADFDFFTRARAAGYRFREIDMTICRKPYRGGVSDNLLGRLRDRYIIGKRHYPEMPVADQLLSEIVAQVR
jgi:glycosyltransferase involved in cell wall biosynthesis